MSAKVNYELFESRALDVADSLSESDKESLLHCLFAEVHPLISALKPSSSMYCI